MDEEFLIFVFGVGVIIYLVFNLRGRVSKLEQLVKGVVIHSTPNLGSQPQPQPGQGVTQMQQAAVPSVQPIAQTIKPMQIEPTTSEKFIQWLKEDWLMKLGAFLLLIGFGWLTTYAFMNDWIGPVGRITFGIVAGALFIILGYWRIRNYINQGGIFLVLGSTVILLTTFAARALSESDKRYDLFTPTSALILMFLSVVFVALASVKYNSRALSVMSLILASIAPALTNAPSSDHIGLFAYLFIVVLGAIWIVALTGQRVLTTASLIIISIYSAHDIIYSFKGSAYPDDEVSYKIDLETLLYFAYAFAILFFITNTIGIIKLKGKEITHDMVAAAGNGLFLLAWIIVAAQEELRSLIISAWMIIFIIGAFVIFKITQRKEPFYTYAGVGIAMLAAATAIELEGPALTVAYTIESGIVALITYIILRDIKIAEKMSLLMIGPAILAFDSIDSSAWYKDVIHEDFFVLLVLSITMLGIGAFFYVCANETGDKKKYGGAILLVAGSIYAYILLWLSLHAGPQNTSEDYDIATMISLVIYTIIGIIAYFYGLARNIKGVRIYGGVLVGFVVIRLLMVDIWKMEITGRIITFFVIGALLITTAFLGKKRRDNEIFKNNSRII